MASRIVFTAKQRVELESFPDPHPGPGEVRVRAVCSLMSTGTENIVFNRAFDTGTHWERWAGQYPFYPGYAMIGHVDEVGAAVEGLATGAMVACRPPHASHAILPAAECVPVPPGIEPRPAAWFALAKIAFVGARAADYRAGERVLVIGAGPVGQMSVRWAHVAGAQTIVVVDPAAVRLEMARAGGATATIAASAANIGSDVRTASGGHLPPKVIDTTGNTDVFAEALALVGDRGRMVLLGDSGRPGQQHLTSEFITRGLTIVGAHDSHIPRADEPGVYRLFFDLLRDGRFRLDGLNTHVFSPGRCVDAYVLANARREETMGIFFDWAGG